MTNKTRKLTSIQIANLKEGGITNVDANTTEYQALQIVKQKSQRPTKTNRKSRRKSLLSQKRQGLEVRYNRRQRRDKGIFGPLSEDDRKLRNLAPIEAPKV